MMDLLSDVTAWCAKRGPSVLWTMMQTLDEGKPGFQMLVMNHADGEALWHVNAATLDELRELVAALIGAEPTTVIE